MQPKQRITLDTKYSRRFTMRRADGGHHSNWRPTVVTTVPIEIVESAARQEGIPVDEFIKSYNVEWFFGAFEGGYVRFTPRQP